MPTESRRRPTLTVARCLKITEKVLFDNASEACGQTVLPVRQILLENASLWLENSNDIKCWSVCQTPFLMILKKLFGKVQISNFPSFWTCFSCPIEHFRCSNFKLFPLICLSATGETPRAAKIWL